MNHAVLPPLAQPLQKRLDAKGKRQQRKQNEININNSENDLDLEDRQKLTSAFAWLIEEDKKQNPSLYQIRKHQ